MNLGNQKEKKEFDRQLYTGFGTFKVIACNPDLNALSKIYNYTPAEDAKEPEYTGKTQSGDEYVDVVFYLKSDVKVGNIEPILQHRVRLVDKEVKTDKDGVEKWQYCNSVGQSSWCSDKKDLLDRFTHAQDKQKNNVGDRTVRVSIQGEGNLYSFLTAWLDAGVSFYGEASVETDILIDKKRAFRNVEKWVDTEFRPLIGSERTGSFGGLAMVGIQEKDGNVKHFQNMYNEFWPSWKFKNLQGAINTGNWDTEQLRKTKEYLQKGLKKTAFSLGWMKPFNSAEHVNAGNETFVESAEDESPDSSNVDMSY